MERIRGRADKTLALNTPRLIYCGARLIHIIRGKAPVPGQGKLPSIFISDEIKPFTPIAYPEKEESYVLELGSLGTAAAGSSTQ
ncbi:hypothetical protein PanWU01x14_017030, partial [Parasponia andersonii]